MHVLATAGHVDHGKSTLVRALTGMEPDRWAEERRRGMTIDLGFAWTPADTDWLPAGEQIAFVDVPGHERFLKNMLAGVGATPAVVFVVAADGGWMPQSQEHLDVLNALDVRRGLLVLTLCDLADDEQRASTRAVAVGHLATTSLRDVPVVEVSAATGAGLDDLHTVLAQLVADLPAADAHADLRLWVDRAFTVTGAGTVVTGTLTGGMLSVGDEVELATTSERVRVRGLQVLGHDTSSVPPVARVAINLRGVDRSALERGQALLAPGMWLRADLIDVRLTAGNNDAHATDAATLPRHLTLHVGASAVAVTVRPLGGDTARLTLAHPLPLRVGDRIVLRDAGLHRVIGARLLDVRPPALGRRGAATTRAADLATMPDAPDLADELRRRGIVAAATLTAAGIDIGGVTPVHGWLVDPSLWDRLGVRLQGIVTEHTTAGRLTPGPTTEDARRQLRLPDRRLVDELVARLDDLHLRDGMVQPQAGTDSADRLPPAVRRSVDAVRTNLDAAPFRAPEAHDLTRLGLGPAELGAAVRAGLLLKIADGIYLRPGAETQAAQRLLALTQPFTISEARQALDTTRRVAVPLLELLDRLGHSVRVDDQHRKITGVHDGGSGLT